LAGRFIGKSKGPSIFFTTTGICCSFLAKSLKRFILDTRLEHALKLLRQNDGENIRSIKEISADCGFSSQQFFSRQFKEGYGMPPTANTGNHSG